MFSWLALERPTVQVSDQPQYDGALLGLLMRGFGNMGANMEILILTPHSLEATWAMSTSFILMEFTVFSYICPYYAPLDHLFFWVLHKSILQFFSDAYVWCFVLIVEEHWIKGFIYEFDLWPLLIIFCLKAVFAVLLKSQGGILVFPPRPMIFIHAEI